MTREATEEKVKGTPSTANQIRANSVARANGWGGVTFIEGEYRPYSGDSPWYDPGPDLTEDELRERYPEWSW